MRKSTQRVLLVSGFVVTLMSGSATANSFLSGWHAGSASPVSAALQKGISPGVIARQALQQGQHPTSVASSMLTAGLPDATVRSAIVSAGGPSSAVHRAGLGANSLAFGPGFGGGPFQDVLQFKLRLLKKILGNIFPGFPPSPH